MAILEPLIITVLFKFLKKPSKLQTSHLSSWVFAAVRIPTERGSHTKHAKRYCYCLLSVSCMQASLILYRPQSPWEIVLLFLIPSVYQLAQDSTQILQVTVRIQIKDILLRIVTENSKKIIFYCPTPMICANYHTWAPRALFCSPLEHEFYCSQTFQPPFAVGTQTLHRNALPTIKNCQVQFPSLLSSPGGNFREINTNYMLCNQESRGSS